MNRTRSDHASRVLVLAPVGRDAPLLVQVLADARIAAHACADGPELARALEEGAAAVLMTEHALVPATVAELERVLSAQPRWSDLPLVLLAGSDAGALHSVQSQGVAAIRARGNLTVVERPVRARFLVTLVESALRARERQYELRDLIEQEQRARELAEDARREAEAASQAKDAFLATVSHELRTPLSAILLWSRLLMERRTPEATLERALASIERSAQAQSKLIEDLLDVSRATSGKLTLDVVAVDVGVVAAASLLVIGPAADAKRITIDQAIEPVGAVVRGDPDRLQQVLVNVLANAVKFTPAGGRISLRVAREDAKVAIEITDTGCGMPADLVPHVFERFRQADTSARRQHGGLGLGLAISRQLVELHGGIIRASSAGEGQGSTFRIELPVAAEHASTLAAASTPVAEELPLRGVRVLLAEDDTDTRDAMTMTLERFGAEVHAVPGGQAAIDALSSAGADERPHVLVSDLGMPGMDGFELLRRVRELEALRGDAALPAAMLTAYARGIDRTRALEAGFAEHLAKPLRPNDLAIAVERLARRGNDGSAVTVGSR